jgi:hypothetical protein
MTEQGNLQVSGVLRGSGGISANQLVHLTGYGDYPCLEISSAGGKVEKSGPDRESMTMLAELDPFAHEQSLTGLEDAMESL